MLNKKQSLAWDSINSVFNALVSVGAQEAQITDQMEKHLPSFSELVEHKLKPRMSFGETPKLWLVDCAKDNIKVSVTPTNHTLRIRSEEIRITVAAGYNGQYAYSNAAIAASLFAAAEQVQALDQEVCSYSVTTALTNGEVSEEQEDDSLGQQPGLDPTGAESSAENGVEGGCNQDSSSEQVQIAGAHDPQA